MIKINFPFKFYAKYADGFDTEMCGPSEEDCIENIANLQDKHGECVWYSGAQGDGYVDGEYIGDYDYD